LRYFLEAVDFFVLLYGNSAKIGPDIHNVDNTHRLSDTLDRQGSSEANDGVFRVVQQTVSHTGQGKRSDTVTI
jgi:hypothetical protein